MIEVGQTVGNYRVMAKLGEGGMGAVFLAEHPVIGRKAALKVIHPQHARNVEVVARFVNEATAISRIGNEHIVEVTDLGRTETGDFYFIMEYLEGQPLAELIASEAPLPPERAVAIAAQIADALAASHAQGVIHRDLKPENIFLLARGDHPDFVKVLDFGLATLVRGDAATDMRPGVVMGTPYYMSPEQCRAGADIDARADVYALGVVLFEMLTGMPPFGGEAFGEVLLKQVSMPAPSARSLVPDLPVALDALLHRALEKDPDLRFATMVALREALLAATAPTGALPMAALDDAHTARMELPRARRAAALRADDAALDRVPHHQAARAIAIAAAAALGGVAIAAFVTRGAATPATALAAELPPPEVRAAPTVLVSFGSEPDGATVVDAAGTPIGATPLSLELPRARIAVQYVFRKPGFLPTSISFVPDVPSSTFALLRAERPAPPPIADDGPPPARHADATPHRHREDPAEQGPPPLDQDGVLAPSFAK